MADTVVPAALVEIQIALKEIDPLLEGLRDFARLNLKPETRVIIDDAILTIEDRQNKLKSANTALEVLLADDYPGLPIKEIPQAAYADLSENNMTIDTALAHFAPVIVSSLGLGAGSPEPKD